MMQDEPRDRRPEPVDAPAPEGRPTAGTDGPAERPPAEPVPSGSWPTSDLPPEAEAHQPSSAPAPDEAAEEPPAPAWPAGDRARTGIERERREREATEGPPAEAESFDRSREAGPAAEGATAAQSVPATEIGESTRCPRCGTENRPGIAFCRSCGQRLMAAGVAPVLERPGAPEGTQACPRCGTHNRAGTAFCQNCGANLRAAAAPAGAPAAGAAPEPAAAPARRGAVLGPVVLLIAAIGLVVGWLLPFPFGVDSLYERAFGEGGYGAAFWAGYPDVGGTLPEQAYFGAAAPVPLLLALLVILALAGFRRAVPGGLQTVGLIVALLWSIALAALFVIVEAGAGLGGDLLGMLRNLTAGGIILFLASLIALIGVLTRFARG